MKNSYKILYRLWLGLLMGIITGVFGKAVNISMAYMFSHFSDVINVHAMLILPIAGGLLLGLYRKYASEDNPAGFDVSSVRNEIHCIETYLMRPKYVLFNMMALLICLFSGWSVGKQGPVVYLGAAMGSFFAYRKKHDSEEVKILISSGVSGILASIFGAPLFAIAFVIEVILNEKSVRDYAPIIISAVVSLLVCSGLNMNLRANQFMLCSDFVMNFSQNIAFESIGFIILGIIAGVLASVYTNSIINLKRMFISANRPIIIAVLAGCMISGIGYVYPQIFNAHIQIIPNIISKYTGLYFLIGILIAKFIVTIISLSAGGVGGVFVTGIYIGACIGKIVGIVLITLNITTMPSDIYAIIGMMAFFAGFANAPLSASFLAVELTAQSAFLMPVLIVSLISGAVFKLITKQSLYGNYDSDTSR